MYRSCLICHGDLGQNTVLEFSSVGRTIAFDGRSGRVWIVCHRCRNWNLTPLEERWEAIEECQRTYEHSPRRYSTHQIGTAVHGGVRLVRIGGPSEREFAAWRYGQRRAALRARSAAQSAAGVLTLGGVAAFGTGLLFGASAIGIAGYVALLLRTSWLPSSTSVLAHLPSADGSQYPVTKADLRYLRVLPEDSEFGWALDTQTHAFRDMELRQSLALVLPWIRRWKGGPLEQAEAIQLVRESGGAEGYLGSLRTLRLETLASWTPAEILAVEMAANDEVERKALEGELKLLLLAWKEADALATIADGLLIPLPVEERLLQLRQKAAFSGDRSSGTRSYTA